MEKNNVVDKRDGSKGRHHLMKKVKVVIFILGLTLGVGLLTPTSLGDVTVTYYWGDVIDKVVFPSDAKADIKMDCRGYASSGSCVQCDSCHSSEPQSAILSKLTQASWDKHVNSYFPRQTHSLSEGQRLLWDREGGYYINQRNRLVRYRRDNQLVWTAPSGSRILKNKRGEPFAVLFSGSR
jgi:hypothetical protein